MSPPFPGDSDDREGLGGGDAARGLGNHRISPATRVSGAGGRSGTSSGRFSREERGRARSLGRLAIEEATFLYTEPVLAAGGQGPWTLVGDFDNNGVEEYRLQNAAVAVTVGTQGEILGFRDSRSGRDFVGRPANPGETTSASRLAWPGLFSLSPPDRYEWAPPTVRDDRAAITGVARDGQGLEVERTTPSRPGPRRSKFPPASETRAKPTGNIVGVLSFRQRRAEAALRNPATRTVLNVLGDQGLFLLGSRSATDGDPAEGTGLGGGGGRGEWLGNPRCLAVSPIGRGASHGGGAFRRAPRTANHPSRRPKRATFLHPPTPIRPLDSGDLKSERESSHLWKSRRLLEEGGAGGGS